MNKDKIKQWIRQKSQEQTANRGVRAVIRLLYVIWYALLRMRRWATDPNYRAILAMQLRKPKDVQQTTSTTGMNRYPHIFQGCADYLQGKPNLRILSYGCSTGEEVLTLRQYFPDATIVGADLNKDSLRKCRRLPIDDKMIFQYSDMSKLEQLGPFDAIFCMAVLQRTPHVIANQGIDSLKMIYPFEKFERQVVQLDRLVKPDGLLVLHYTQYSLWDTSIAPNYEAIEGYDQRDYYAPVFDKNSRIRRGGEPQESVYRKVV